MDRLRKHYLVWSSFLARKAAWALSWCMTTESAHYCILVNEWAWLRLPVCLLWQKVHGLGSRFGVRGWTEIGDTVY